MKSKKKFTNLIKFKLEAKKLTIIKGGNQDDLAPVSFQKLVWNWIMTL